MIKYQKIKFISENYKQE